ncbi:MAG: hypothetical protein ACUVXA_13410 [Candidatus Jordarchaeum sp.]|uniref:hypothetical protein n=1 Tax=Candidatus Jordarchaeum sp. TaxID=2823881 RepID=UPI004049BAB9
MSMVGGKYFSKIRKIKSERNLLLLEAEGRATYIAVITLKGSPDYESLDPGYMDLFIKSIQNLDVDVSLVIPFKFVKVNESESMLKKDLRVRILVNGKIPVKYFEVSPYLVIREPSLENLKNHMKRVSVAASAAWSGVKKRLSLEFLDSKEIKKFLHHIICRRLLPERELFRIKNLATYLRIPTMMFQEMTRYQMIIPSAVKESNSHNNNRVLLGNTDLLGRNVPVWMGHDDFSKCVVILGESPQKINFLWSLLKKISKPWTIFDFKDEFSKFKDFRDLGFFFAPGSDSEPLRINLFDSIGKTPAEHAAFLLNVFKKVFENEFEMVEEPLCKILSHFSAQVRYKQGLNELNKAFDEIFKLNDSPEQSSVRELASLLRNLQHGIMNKIFFNEDSNVDLKRLINDCVLIDLTQIISKADITELKFLLAYIHGHLFNKSTKNKSELRHLTVINCPENNSNLINFLTKVIFKSSLPDTSAGLILITSQPQDLNGVESLDSYYKIIFNSVKETKNTAEILGTTPQIIENLGKDALMIIPETEKQIIFHPDYDKNLLTEEIYFSKIPEKQIVSKLNTAATSSENKEETGNELFPEISSNLLNGDFITADAFLKGARNSNKISFDTSYNFSSDQIETLVERISHMLEREMYLTDIYISRLTSLPYNIVNKILREILNQDSDIQRIYVPVVGNKANIPLYYSKFGPKYESVQDKYLKDTLEEWCFKTGTQLSVKKDLEAGADGQIESHHLKLFVHRPEDNELKNIFQKLFLKYNQIAILFLYDKDLIEAEKLNSQWRIPLIMGCLSNLNVFLKEIQTVSTEKMLNQTYTSEKELQEFISWLEADT